MAITVRYLRGTKKQAKKFHTSPDAFQPHFSEGKRDLSPKYDTEAPLRGVEEFDGLGTYAKAGAKEKLKACATACFAFVIKFALLTCAKLLRSFRA